MHGAPRGLPAHGLHPAAADSVHDPGLDATRDAHPSARHVAAPSMLKIRSLCPSPSPPSLASTRASPTLGTLRTSTMPETWPLPPTLSASSPPLFLASLTLLAPTSFPAVRPITSSLHDALLIVRAHRPPELAAQPIPHPPSCSPSLSLSPSPLPPPSAAVASTLRTVRARPQYSRHEASPRARPPSAHLPAVANTLESGLDPFSSTCGRGLNARDTRPPARAPSTRPSPLSQTRTRASATLGTMRTSTVLETWPPSPPFSAPFPPSFLASSTLLAPHPLPLHSPLPSPPPLTTHSPSRTHAVRPSSQPTALLAPFLVTPYPPFSSCAALPTTHPRHPARSVPPAFPVRSLPRVHL